MMKRINSNSWKKPFDGEFRASQDSAYSCSQDKFHNSQSMEFSQVTTQDLFGQSSQSQNEPTNQKMSMYDKWLSKRSLNSKSNYQSHTGSVWTPKSTELPGKSVSKIASTSCHRGFVGNRLNGDERDDQRELLEMMFNSFLESKQEIKSLVSNLQEYGHKIGGSFNDEAKVVLSSFMEDIAKNNDSFVAQLQSIEISKDKEKELESQIARKNSQIASLESKMQLLEDQIKKSEACDNQQSKEFQEEMKGLHQSVIKKLEEMTETIGYQKDSINHCKMNMEDLKEEVVTTSKGVQSGVKESESRIVKEIKKLPKDLKNALDIKPDVMSIFEGLPIDIEHSLNTKLSSFTKSIKDEFSKEHKKHNEQVLRKQFDKMSGKMDCLVSEHKKIQQLVISSIHDSMTNQLKDIEQCIRNIGDNSSTDSLHMSQIKQSITHCQDEQSLHLQNMLTQQKEFNEQIKNILENDIESKRYKGNRHQENSNVEKSPLSDATLVNTNKARQEYKISESNCNTQELHLDYQCVKNDRNPSNKVIHRVVDAKVNNIHMPVINQTNIYPSSHRENGFNSPYNFVNNKNKNSRHHHMIMDKANLDNSSISFDCHFKRPTQTYSKCKPSPVAAIKPQCHMIDNHMTLKENAVNKQESHQFYSGKVQHFINKNDRGIQQKAHIESSEINKNNSQENGYWLRNRNDLLYNERRYIRETPRRPNVFKESICYPSSKQNQTKCNINSKESVGDLFNNGCGSTRRAIHQLNGDSTADKSDVRNTADRIHHKMIPENRKRPWHDDCRGDDDRRALDASVYDFNEDDVVTPRQKLSHKEMYYERSSVSSPALTINLDWACSQKKQRELKSGFFQTRTPFKDNTSSILDLH